MVLVKLSATARKVVTNEMPILEPIFLMTL